MISFTREAEWATAFCVVVFIVVSKVVVVLAIVHESVRLCGCEG